MEIHFKEKTGKVVVVDGSAPVRQLLSECAKALGFKDIQGVPSIEETLAVLEVEHVSWIICPLGIEQEVHNVFGLLRLCASHPELRHVRVTLLLEDTEQEFLPCAYEQGLMSHLAKPFNKDTLTESLQNLLARLEANQWDATLTAAEYLNQALCSSKDYVQALDLTRKLLEIYPGNDSVAADTLLPLIKLEKFDEARSTIAQLRLLQPNETIQKKISDAESALPPLSESANATPPNLLSIKSCIVIEPDADQAKIVSDLLAQIGAEGIMVFADGETAWEHIKANAEPTVIVQEWQIPKLSGPVILQRTVSHGFLSVPVLVISKSLQPQDIPLMKEMGVANVVLKPMNSNTFLATLASTLRQDRSPTDTRFLERKIRILIKKGDLENARILVQKISETPGVPEGNRRLIEAELAFASGAFVKAKDLAIAALQLCGDSILILNLLGKTFMKLNDFTNSLKCFEKAQTLSPMNIARICAIAEVSSEVGENDKSQEALDHAKMLDSGNEAVGEAEAKIAINNGDTGLAKKVMGDMESLNNVISYMNNKAVALARSGKIPESMDLYRKAYDAIPEGRPEVLSAVSYNTALAYVRGNDLEKSMQYLDKVLEIGSPRMKKKADSLKQRVTYALKRGEKLVIQDRPDEPQKGLGESSQSQADKSDLVISSIDAQRGDICCHLLFYAKTRSDRVKKLLGKLPHYTPRKAIAREAAHGVERLMHASGN